MLLTSITYPFDINTSGVRHLVEGDVIVVQSNLTLQSERVVCLHHLQCRACRGVDDCRRIELIAKKLLYLTCCLCRALTEHHGHTMPAVRVEDHHVTRRVRRMRTCLARRMPKLDEEVEIGEGGAREVPPIPQLEERQPCGNYSDEGSAPR